MPRINDKERARIRKSVLKEIEAGRTALHLTKQEFVEKLGINYKTFYNRLQTPDDFKLDELLKIANELNISIYRLLGIRDYTITKGVM